MPPPPKGRGGGDDSDEDNEYYKRPTLAERVGPEEARRMLMDDDDEGDDYNRSVSKKDEDDDKSMKSEQSAAGASEKSAHSTRSGASHTSARSGVSERSGVSMKSAASAHSEVSAKSAMSAVSGVSGKSGASIKSAVSTLSTRSGASVKSTVSAVSAVSGVSGVSGVSATSGVSAKSGMSIQSGMSVQSGLSIQSAKSAKSDVSGMSGVSGLSRASGASKASARTDITTASERSTATALTDVVDEDYYAPVKESPKPKSKKSRRKVREESTDNSDCESEKSDVSHTSQSSTISHSSSVASVGSSRSEGSAISAHSRHSLTSHLSSRSATSAASEDSKIVSRFARGPFDQTSGSMKGSDIEVTQTTDITSDHQSTVVTSAMESDSMHSGTDTEIEEDLSEVRAGSAILPNLTIAIERDEDPGIVISFIKLKGPAPSGEDSGVKVIRSNKTLQKLTEEEWNLARGIPVLGLGIDKHSPEQLKKQQARARRFGLDINKNMEEGEIDDSEINPVGETLIMEMTKRIEDFNTSLNLEQLDQMIVEKTLCVIGCNDLHTEDILKFFNNFKPDKVAWVDDSRVKLSWHQQSASIRCLMSSTLSGNTLKQLNAKAKKRYKTRGEKPPSEGEDEDSGMETDDDITCPLEGALNCERKCIETLLSKNGKTYKLQLRFATKSDEKERGAQSKSKYYVRFGNPNYGGMKGLLSKSFKRRFNNKKTREDLHKAAEKLGMKMKPQTTQYDPKSEKLDTNRHKADVELINSSVQDIPEAIPVEKASRMAPPMAPPSNGYDSERSRDSDRSRRDSYTSESGRSSRNGSRWDSSSARSDSESDTPKKSLKSRLGVPKKKNERTGITITLSRSNDEKRHRRRKRSYDAESDTSEVSSSTDKDIDYRRIGKSGKENYYEDSDTESVRSDATTSSRHSATSGTSMASSHVSRASDTSGTSRVSETSAATESSDRSYNKRRRTDDESYESDSSMTSHASGSSHASRRSEISSTGSHTSGSSMARSTNSTSHSEYDSDTAQSDSAQSEVSYIGRRDSQKAHPSATICKLAAVKNHASKRRPMFGPASGKFDRRKLNEMNMTIDVQVDRTGFRSDTGMDTD